MLEETDDIPEYLKTHTKFGHESYLAQRKERLLECQKDEKEKSNLGLQKEISKLNEIEELIQKTEELKINDE